MKTNTPNRLSKVLAVSLMTLASGCLSVPHGNCRSECGDAPKPKGAKTLFSWAVGPADDEKSANKDDEKKNGKDADVNGEGKKDQSEKDTKGNVGKGTNGDDKAAAMDDKQVDAKSKDANGNDADDPKPLESDRPDFTEASSTVGRGRIQLEGGYTYFRDRAEGNTKHSHSYPEMLLRIGLFADWFEFRVGQNFGTDLINAGGLRHNEHMADDLYLGTKLALTEQKKALPEMAVILQMTVPSGGENSSANRVLPGVNLLYGWDVIEDCLSIGGSTQANRSVDDARHSYVEAAQSLTVGYTLTKKLGAYTEWFALIPTGAVAPDFGPQHYFDGGFTYKVTDNLQLDIRAGVGLNRHADDFFVGSGFAVRY